MKAVYKYPVDSIRQPVYVDIPKGGTVLSVGKQPHGSHVLWALVDTDIERIYSRVFYIAYTGEVLPPEFSWVYINTYTSEGLVYHAFEAI